MLGSDYTPDSMARSANALIAMGETDAYDVLRSYASETPRDTWHAMLRADRIALLCRALYEGCPRSPAYGGMLTPLQSADPADWPRFPLALSDDVMLLLANGRFLAGVPESSMSYLEYCKANGTFRKKPYAVPTKEEASAALNALFLSDRWARIKWKDSGQGYSYQYDEQSEKENLRMQIDRMQ